MPTLNRCGWRPTSIVRQVTRTPDYQQFIDATGIVPERDLDSIAFALHRMDDPNGPNGPVGYSEVFEGRFDGASPCTLPRHDRHREGELRGHDIFTIRVGDGKVMRPLRISQLEYDTIAASNMPTPNKSIPFSIGTVPRLRRFRLVAFILALSRCACIFERLGDWPHRPSLLRPRLISIFGLQLPLTEDTTFVASLRYLGICVCASSRLLPPMPRQPMLPRHLTVAAHADEVCGTGAGTDQPITDRCRIPDLMIRRKSNNIKIELF